MEEMRMTLEQIIKAAYNNNASDIHITSGTPPVIRAGGELLRLGKTKLMPEDTQALAKEIFEISDYSKKFEENGEVDFSFALGDYGRFRANIYKQRGSVAVAIRLIPKEIPELSTLGIPDSVIKLADKSRGLVCNRTYRCRKIYNTCSFS